MAIYLDTETTGLSHANGDKIVEIAIVDDDGKVLINTLVNPEISIPWYATKVHGITDSMVIGKPTLNNLMPNIIEIIRDREIIIYNAQFDASFFPRKLSEGKIIKCAMQYFNLITEIQGSRKLDFAALCAGHVWQGEPHRALADAMACRSVWLWLHSQAA